MTYEPFSFNFAYIGPAKTREEAIDRLLAHKGPIAVDTETIGLKGDKAVPWDLPPEDEDLFISTDESYPLVKNGKTKIDARTLIGFGIAISETEAFYFPRSLNSAWVNVPQVDYSVGLLKLWDRDCQIWFWNAMFDLERLEEAFGIDDIDGDHFHDVAAACQVQALPAALDRCALELLGYYHADISDILPKKSTMLDVEFRTTAFKCLCDVLDTFRMGKLIRIENWNRGNTITYQDFNSLEQWHSVSPDTQQCYEVDRQCIPLLRRMSRRGIALRKDKVNSWHSKLSMELKAYEDFFRGKGINVFSNDQVGWFLSAERRHYIGLTPSGKHLKVDEEVLTNIGSRDPIVFMILAARRRRKLLSTYITPVLDKERVNPHFNLNLATGRLSSHGPNIQNQPDRIREIFAPDNPTGEWYWMDYQQAEMRVWASQANDKVMLKAFEEGVSPHEVTLKRLFHGVPKKKPGTDSSTREYTDSKSFNFALLFDSSAGTLAKTTRRPVAQVAAYQSELFELYHDSKRYIDEKKTDDSPHAVTDFGRYCRIPDGIYVDEDHRAKCRINYPTQGTIADVVKRSMLVLDGQNFDDPIQVHDEVVQDGDKEFPKYLALIHPKIPLPFDTHKGPFWQ